MTVQLLIANILSLISTVVLVVSLFVKSKEKMLLLQAGNCILGAFSNILASSYAGACSSIISFFRNAYLSQRTSLIATIVFSVLYVVLGVLTNIRGFIGLLPVLASVEYTLFVHFAKTAQVLRYGALINLLLWAIHDICIGLYGALISDIVLIVITIISIAVKKDSE